MRHPLTSKEEAEVAAAMERLERQRHAMGVSPPAPRPTPQPQPELSALAEKVKRLRSALGLSQPALARSLGVKVLAVKRWESGKAKPREKILKRLEELEASLGGSPRE